VTNAGQKKLVFRGGQLVRKNSPTIMIHVRYTSSPGQERLFFWPAFVTRLLTPRSRKSGYGLLLGCRSPLDAGHEKKNFFSCFSSSKNRENIVWRSCPASQSIGRGRISREGALDHRESRERRDKIFAAKTVKRQNFQKKKGSGKQFSVGNFHFFGRGKTNFFRDLQKWLASDHPGAYTSMPHPCFGAKDVCYIQKKVAKKKAFLGQASLYRQYGYTGGAGNNTHNTLNTLSGGPCIMCNTVFFVFVLYLVSCIVQPCCQIIT